MKTGSGERKKSNTVMIYRQAIIGSTDWFKNMHVTVYV